MQRAVGAAAGIGSPSWGPRRRQGFQSRPGPIGFSRAPATGSRGCAKGGSLGPHRRFPQGQRHCGSVFAVVPRDISSVEVRGPQQKEMKRISEGLEASPDPCNERYLSTLPAPARRAPRLAPKVAGPGARAVLSAPARAVHPAVTGRVAPRTHCLAPQSFTKGPVSG